jgi:cytochrome c peroxidase
MRLEGAALTIVGRRRLFSTTPSPDNATMQRLRWHHLLLASSALFGAACGDGGTEPDPKLPVGVDAPPALLIANTTQASTVGTPFNMDATVSGTAFSDPRAGGLTYSVSFTPTANGLSATGGRISGTPAAPGVTTATITARDVKGGTASGSFAIVTFAAGLLTPTLPATPFAYSDASSPLPIWFTQPTAIAPPVVSKDNMPASNVTTDAGAAVGRVLFYDTRLSVNDRVSCSSCHLQQFGFSDTARLSKGFDGGSTGRHSMALANSRFYASGRYFWDERASTLEAQVLQPIQDAVEMGTSLDKLVLKVSATSYYPALFQAAFGSSEITSDRIARALAQFVRSLVSAQSRSDLAFANPGNPNFNVLTPQEAMGQALFTGPAGCAPCHSTVAQTGDGIHSTGLDATITDAGAGGGRFKSPSLRNIAVRAPYMHDGRFRTLAEVVEFYDNGVQPAPNLDQRLRGPNGQPRRLNLTPQQKAALVAYLGTLTDPTFLTAPKFATPFVR